MESYTQKYQNKNYVQLIGCDAKMCEVYKERVIIISDLNIDYIIDICKLEFNNRCEGIYEQIGGCAYNAAIYFKKNDLFPVIIGSIGNDINGQKVIDELNRKEIYAFLDRITFPTGVCNIAYCGNQRLLYCKQENANKYSIAYIKKALTHINMQANDVAFITAHIFLNVCWQDINELLSFIKKRNVKIVLDVVPHDIFVDNKTLNSIFDNLTIKLDIVISNLGTLLDYCNIDNIHNKESELLSDKDICIIMSKINADMFVIRYGKTGTSKQAIIKRIDSLKYKIIENIKTDYENLDIDEKTGYGEVLAAKIIKKYLFAQISEQKGEV